ncbi:hypothetical protein AncyloWKF20_09135 [Ancylobacter sp. WKF20]|uniref:hypothetical protein n=1 Tax=Ancylobacter sp. WKF20 TaxID=3039801 RepID=UPI002434192F|nr:hypothetical protein [Ancylobacter sp. WKF20]WGD31964.1 hypothetical protein AncyloWKF20_09135 [Ancylobacter sp. WKF20]
MRRFFPRGHMPALPGEATALCRRATGLALPLLALPLLALPASAQTAFDPWSGIAVTVTPAPDESSAYDDAVADTPPPPTEATPAVAGAVATTPVGSEDTQEPSLWDALSLAIGGDLPELPKEKPAPNQLLPARKPVVTTAKPTVPTSLEVEQGPAHLAVSTNASGSAPKSGLGGATDGGASGEIKARLGVEQNNLSVYSTGVVGASASTSTPSLYDNLAVGSSYSVPLSSFGLGQEKLGASVEVTNSQTVTTGMELRAPLGTYERFISVERTASPDSTGSGIVKAGVLGKF